MKTYRLATCALVLALTGCLGSGKLKDPSSVGARFENVERMVFAFELKPTCRLQMTTQNAGPNDKSWSDVNVAALANRSFKILRRKTTFPSKGMDRFLSQAYSLEGETGDPFWIRNVPAETAAQAIEHWSCAFDDAAVARNMPKLKAPVVRLSASSTGCTGFSPIFGGVDAVTFAPYTVTARSLFSQGGQGVVGLRLEADGGEKAITVTAAAFDQCFVAADRAPPAPRESEALRLWLGNGSEGGTELPPPVSVDTVEQLTALQLERCMREGTGVLTHHECRMPILRIVDTKQSGLYGPSSIRFVRQRVADAIHLYAGHLVPSVDIVTANVAVRLGKAAGESFGRSFHDVLETSLLDGPLRVRRASNGFRLLRAADVSAGVPATHYVNIDLSFTVPDVVVTTEQRVHKYVAGQKAVHNPKFDEAEQEVAQAKEALASAKRAAEFIEEGTKLAAKEAGDACKKAGEKAGGLLGGVMGGALCNSATNAAGGLAERAALKGAEERMSAAQRKLAETPATVSVDDTRDYTYEAKVYKRSGDAVARFDIVQAGQQRSQAPTSVTFHFDASDDEVPGSSEHKLNAKAARVPTAADVERELSTNLLKRIDEAIIRWGAQRQVGGDIGELQPGTRSWMVAVARHAASDRNVKLLSDLLENRSDALSKEFVDYPVKMPKKVDGRCFTFAAIPLDPAADVNLTLGIVRDKSFSPLAVDTRATPEAAFEMCNLPADTTFSARVTPAKKGALSKGILVSMFDSTPQVATADDTIAASRGIPTMARKGEELVLNGEGVVEFRGLNNQVVVGRTGDRDGDGIPDDEDRCPYDPETKNGYLDGDGCPDVPPEGWTPPSTSAPAGGTAGPTPAPRPTTTTTTTTGGGSAR